MLTNEDAPVDLQRRPRPAGRSMGLIGVVLLGCSGGEPEGTVIAPDELGDETLATEIAGADAQNHDAPCLGRQDGEPCVPDDLCATGRCEEGTCEVDGVIAKPATTPPGDGCLVWGDQCTAGEWSTLPAPDGHLCGSPCLPGTCHAGACAPADPIACPAPTSDQIAKDCLDRFECDEATGECTRPVWRTAGAKCEIGNPCTDDTCEAMEAGSDSTRCVQGPAGTCPDRGPCTPWTCDAIVGCIWTLEPAGTACDDANPCTANDACTGTVAGCQGLDQVDDANPCTVDLCDPVAGPEHVVTPGAPCDDANACTGSDECTGAGGCAGELADPQALCDDSDPCTADECDPSMGCQHTVVADATACDDANACTGPDACVAGVCEGAGGSCNDGNPCTADLCDPEVGCTWPPAAGPCDDGDACTQEDACVAGACVPGGAVACEGGDACTLAACVGGLCTLVGLDVCDDEDPCTTDACDPVLGCQASVVADGSPCGETNPCLGPEVCEDGACVAQAVLNCDDGEPCTLDSCDQETGACEYSEADDGTPCEDGTACTFGDSCVSGQCQVTEVSCPPEDACTLAATCDPATGECPSNPKEDWTVCDDGDACSWVDVCIEGLCVGTDSPCDDGLPCTSDPCDGNGGCLAPQPVAGWCVIGKSCVIEETPDPASPCRVCLPGVSAVAYTTLPNGTSCDDGKPCTVGDTCKAGGCSPGPVKSCDDGLACTVDACDASGMCTNATIGGACVIDGQCVVEHDVQPGNACMACRPTMSATGWTPADNGANCDDGQPCTIGDSCQAGVCASGPQVQCDDEIPCTADVCAAGGTCTHAVAPGTCLIDGACVAAGTADPEGACRACRPELSADAYSDLDSGAACDDDEACTAGDLCEAGQCAGQPYTCDDGMPCTADACDGQGGCKTKIVAGCLVGGACVESGAADPESACRTCQPEAATDAYVSVLDGKPCDDGAPCTKTDQCTDGVCEGAPYTCDDGEACTDDECDGLGGCTNSFAEGCVISGACVPAGAVDPSHACRTCQPAQATDVYTPAADGTLCDDGKPCTQSDACASGACAGAPYLCDDGKACTADACNGLGGCTATVTQGCLVDGACVADSAVDPGSACRTCQPAQAADAYSPVTNGVLCDDGAACTKADQCTGGECSGSPYICDDGKACTADACDGQGGCTTTVTQGCLVGGACIPDGAADPSNACRTCQSAQATGAYSPVATDTPCDDGNVCTSFDICTSGACDGTAYVCDDGKACTSDACDGQGGCTTTVTQGCLVAGDCVADGAVDPASACRTCQPGQATGVYSPVANGTLCDDGAPCTKSDQCTSGECSGVPYACDDGKACTADACDGLGGCATTVTQGCLIGGACVAAGTVDPGDDCRACQPNLATGAYSVLANGTQCDDGAPCTKADKCTSGVCAGAQYVCDDGKACTADACDGQGGCTTLVTQGCLVGGACVATGSVDPGSECRTCQPGQTTGAYSPMADGTLCDDGGPCTKSDQCTAGDCSGAPYTCDDGKVCTDDACDGLGGCTTTVTQGCLIGGACVAAGTVDPENACRSCQPTQAVDTYTSVTNGQVCDDGDVCTKDDACSSGSCSGAPYVCPGGTTCNAACDGQGGCTPKPDGAACSDGDECTVVDTCLDGACSSGAKRVCDDGNPCTSDSCAPASGCAVAPLKDGIECPDTLPCTQGATCTAGTCQAGPECGALSQFCSSGACASPGAMTASFVSVGGNAGNGAGLTLRIAMTPVAAAVSPLVAGLRAWFGALVDALRMKGT